MNKLGLVIETVWSDADMLEYWVSASNESFSGITRFYVALDEANKLGECLSGFPSSSSDIREYQLGNSDGTSLGGVFLRFMSDGSGHITVETRLWFDPEVRTSQRVLLFMQSLPADIDSFIADLRSMGTTIGAQAFLRHAI